MKTEALYQIFLKSSGVTTDTRKITENCIFFALNGENFNGNTFANQALEKGAAYAVVDDADFATDKRCLLVDDGLKALQDLANYHRRQFDIPVIGLTGSNGKTTNKELLTAVLKTRYAVHATTGNLNNHIGVPLTLLSMPAGTEMAVIEMGANHQKEIDMLCKIAEPTHGFITNIGRAHLEGFGGEDGVKKGKGELFDFLKGNHGIVFANQNDAKIVEMVRERKLLTVVYYGDMENSLRLISDNPFVSFESPSAGKYSTHLGGKYNFENMQTAFCIGKYFNTDEKEACLAISAYNPDNNRSQVVEVGTNTFYMDAYNANPSSMEASVKAFGALDTKGKKVVVLGDMFELGKYSENEHAQLGKMVSQQGFDFVVLYGNEMKYALKSLPRAHYFVDKFSMHNWLLDMNFQNTTFLVKGSRGVSLESVLKVFQTADS